MTLRAWIAADIKDATPHPRQTHRLDALRHHGQADLQGYPAKPADQQGIAQVRVVPEQQGEQPSGDSWVRPGETQNTHPTSLPHQGTRNAAIFLVGLVVAVMFAFGVR